jgi:hypothetical protein
VAGDWPTTTAAIVARRPGAFDIQWTAITMTSEDLVVSHR